MGRVSYSKLGFLLSHFTRVKPFLFFFWKLSNFLSMRNKIQITRETRNKINERDTWYWHYTWVAQRIALYANWISTMDIVLINSSSIKMSSCNKENCFLGCTNIWTTIKLVQKIMLKSNNNYTQMGSWLLLITGGNWQKWNSFNERKLSNKLWVLYLGLNEPNE